MEELTDSSLMKLVQAGDSSQLAVLLRSAPAPDAKAGDAYTRPFPAKGYAFKAEGAPLVPFAFNRRAIGPNDVAIDIHYCGVCHSDIHTARGDWGPQRVPQITGHDLSGGMPASPWQAAHIWAFSPIDWAIAECGIP